MTTLQEEKAFIAKCFDSYKDQLNLDDLLLNNLLKLKDMMKSTHASGKKVIYVGNGGSAAIASHCAVDFTKNAKIRSINFNEGDLITCFANDFGYPHLFQRALEFYGDAGDLLIAISSGGKSPSIVNAAQFAREKNIQLVTFSGINSDNPLRTMGQINFYVPSKAYNIVETIHQTWLLMVCDLIIGKLEYASV